MKKITAILLRFSNVIIALAVVVLIGGLVFFYSFPFKVAEFKKINITSTVDAGQRIEYTLDFCRYVPKGTKIDVHRFLFPKDKTLISPIELSSNPSLETLDGITGCRTSTPVKLPVDVSTPEGDYRLLIRGDYCIEFTFLRRCIMVEQYSDYFHIGKPDIPSQLSVITQQLEAIERATQQSSSIGNTITPQTAPEAPVPNIEQQTPQVTVPQTTTPQIAPQQASPLRQTLESTRDTTTSILENITKMLHL